MKQSKPVSLLVFAVIAFAMSGCGKSNNSAPPPPGGAVGPYGQYNGGTSAGSFGSGCTPIQSPIAFSGLMYIDSSNVMAGAGAPAPTNGGGYTGNNGTITMSSAPSGAGATYGVITIQAQMLSLNGASGGGTLILSPAAIQQAALSSGVPYGQYPCATVSAIQLTHYNTLLYGGVVRLLINNNVPYDVYF